MPRYLVLDGFCLGGSYGDVYPGATVELSEKEARSNVSIGRLQLVETPPAAAAPPAPPAAPAPEQPAGAAAPEPREPKTTSRSPRGAGKEE